MREELTTPILFIIFNRPDTTKRVFNEIRKAKPTKLFIAADGPRENIPGEMKKCRAARDVINQVDWNCEIHKNYSDVNLGCKVRPSSGIDWLFENVEQGIILEDDCLPHSTFFRFCQELLKKYRDDQRVMVISGDNFLFGQRRTNYSYYFSRYIHTWGWASWRRTWKLYDVNMSLWPEVRDHGWLADILEGEKAVRYWRGIFERVYQGKIDTWDYQLWFACWIQNGLSILPTENLISNIGFGSGATHTCDIDHKLAHIPIKAIQFPLQHPLYVIRNTEADNFMQNAFLSPNLIAKIKARLKFSYQSTFKWVK